MLLALLVAAAEQASLYNQRCMRPQELYILEFSGTVVLHAAALPATAWADGGTTSWMSKECHFRAFTLKIVKRKAALLEFITDFMIYLSENLQIPII